MIITNPVNRAWWMLALALTASAPAGEPALSARFIVSGLLDPLFITYAPGDYGRIFAVEQAGRIIIIRGEIIQDPPFLDIVSRVGSGVERGLLGLVFHPRYEDNGYFFVNYTDLAGDTVVARFEVSSDDEADVASEYVVLRIPQPRSTHNGGWMGFGPDGYLYVATGDGGRAPEPDPENRAQTVTNELLGKILRIDVDRDDWPDDPDRNYGIPKDNPFVGDPGDDEIWAYGLRNPWRCAFDALTGDFYIADVGESQWEEVNFLPAGHPAGVNFGWRCLEGEKCTHLGDCDCATLDSILPIHTYSHEAGCSITGGEVYRGCVMPALHGAYFFADWCSDQIWSMRPDGQGGVVVENRTAEVTPPSGLDIGFITSFGRDAFGEIYLCDGTGGEIFKIVPRTPLPIQVESSVPPDASIDARQPSAPDGSNSTGWRNIQLTFDSCVANVRRTDFDVSQLGGTGTPPEIAAAEPQGERSVELLFTAPIETMAWTVITHRSTGEGRRLGYLPGDVSGDGRAQTSDIPVLIDHFSGSSPGLPLWSTDVDRSGVTAPADLLREIDLLNGAATYTVFNGTALP